MPEKAGCVWAGGLIQLTGHRRLLRVKDLEDESGCPLMMWKEKPSRRVGKCAVCVAGRPVWLQSRARA